jgi:hypothetical protein
MTEEVQEQSISELLTEAMTEHETTEETEAEEVSPATDESESVEEVDAEVTAEAEEDSAEAEPETVFQAPEHWSSDYKARFAELSPEGQEVVLGFDSDFKRGYQDKVQAISDIETALEPWKQTIAQRGISEADAIRTLFAAQSQIEQDPLQGVLALAQRFGVADQLRKQFAPDTDADFIDPEVKALNSKIAELEGKISQTSQQIQQSQTVSAQQELDNFVNAVDADGKPAHPHFEAAKPLIASLVGQGKSLEDAYNEAVWTVPEYRESQSKPEPPAENEVEKARKVKQAKKAARGINQDGTAKTTESDEDLDIKSSLELAWKQHS